MLVQDSDMKNKLITFIILLGFYKLSFAASCSLSSSGGALDQLLQDFYAPTSQWRTTLAPIALQMYWFWFTCEFLWQLTIKKVMGNDISKLYYWMMVRILVANLFAYIFVNPDFYVGIILYFVKLGSQAGGFSVSPTSGNPFAAMSPSAIMDSGKCIWDAAWTAINAAKLGITDMVNIMTVAFPIILMTLAAYVLAAIMGFTLFMTALEGYIVMNAGIILLGFAGSSWTQSYWQKYLSYVGGIAIRLFVMCLILGLIRTMMATQLSDINLAVQTSSGIPGLLLIMAAMIKFLVSMLIFTFLILKVPAMAGSMLTGTVNSGLGDVIAGASMVMAGAGMAAGLGKMGFGGGSGGSGGGAKESFKNALSGNGGGGLPTGGGSGSERATQTATQTAKTSAAKANQAEAMMPKTDSQPSKPTFAQAKAEELGLNKGNAPTNSSSNNGSGNQPTSSKSSPDKSTSSAPNKTSGVDSSSAPKSNDVSGSISGNNNGGNQPQSMADRDAKIKKHGSNFAKHAQSMTQNHNSGAADINISPHKE